MTLLHLRVLRRPQALVFQGAVRALATEEASSQQQHLLTTHASRDSHN